MTEPTTTASRRTLWRQDVDDLVDSLRLHDAEADPDKRRWQISREAYLHGLSAISETATEFSVRAHRVETHQDETAAIPKVGQLKADDRNVLSWHKDQDVRGRPHYEKGYDQCFHDRLPRGPLLVDPLFGAVLSHEEIDEWELRGRIANADGFSEKRVVSIRIDGAPESRAQIRLRMNEVHAVFTIPGETEARWSGGHLTAVLPDIPETLKLGARGKRLGDVLDHDMTRHLTGVTITGITRSDSRGTLTIATSAALTDGMIPIHSKSANTRTAQ